MSRLAIVVSMLLFLGCDSKRQKEKERLSHFFKEYKVEDGFELQLVAAEPLINAPVAIDFDNKGRIWVVEMRGYMPDLAGNGEEKPTGRITILDDFDDDGVAQRSTIFMDSLVLPRALAHVYGGLLYAEPPFLWFVEIDGDKPGRKTLVDSLYADGGYVELQPNGLMMNIDNWIYSANSSSRYQMRNGQWIREPTTFRGQWGISRDNGGRLYYNYNEAQLAGDYVLPNSLIANPFYTPKESENKLLTDDQRVYPLHPTTVNRGYEAGILTKDSLLAKFTAACGPVVYRGDQFPEEYVENVFVCEPQANVIKRNILSFDSLVTTARHAWKDKEFVASTDETFRPVTLLNAPDGSLYVVDMHRGVLEHRAVSSPYYRDGIASKKLDTVLSFGRILRVKSKTKKLDEFPEFEGASASDLIKMLPSDNGWIRDRAQQLLIHRNDTSIVRELLRLFFGDRDMKISKSLRNDVLATHALYTLDGLSKLNFDLLQRTASDSSRLLRAHSLLLLQRFATKENADRYYRLLQSVSTTTDLTNDLYIAATMRSWINVDSMRFLPLLNSLSEKYSASTIFQEAVVSSLTGREQSFATNNDIEKNERSIVDSMLTVALNNKKENKVNPIFIRRSIPLDQRANGMVLFKKTCAGCHGVDGEGIEHVGPPLRESQFVQGSVDRLAMIILNGLEGPIHIKNKEYRFNGTMPNFANNFSDEEISDIIRYLRNSYVTSSRKSISVERVKQLRAKPTGTLTEKKLEQMKD